MKRPFRFNRGGVPKDIHVYCGPRAISAVTGFPADHVVQVAAEVVAPTYRQVRARPGKARVRAMWAADVIETCRRLGFNAFTCTSTLRARRVKDLVRQALRQPDQKFIVQVPGHYIALQGGIIIDCHTPDGGQWFADHSAAKRRVVRVIAVR